MAGLARLEHGAAAFLTSPLALAASARSFAVVFRLPGEAVELDALRPDLGFAREFGSSLPGGKSFRKCRLNPRCAWRAAASPGFPA
jgi:hypothetical protein